ncbi:hypothetical protein OG874_16495 [Nocardia sp. NBC_00565]|uniref:nuclear transport factor 2 family protein n=1 Tax=Nocardia sp. NBC_00565 TaxID=2975993 RepID=UPI002E803C10|nr:hypothetical protein [Nocardia sp. NBC_00565]WUC06618.1 hypothetical protein OG874_16495 [Nocardia sp. NBC_00565]
MPEVTSVIETASAADALFVYEAWHQAATSSDVEALLDLYADDAVMETYMAVLLLKQDSGLLPNKSEIRRFLEANFATRESVMELDQVRFYRTGYQFDGHTLAWEYLRDTPDGDSHEMSEVLELSGRKISKHRIYFGWHGLSGLQRLLTRGK